MRIVSVPVVCAVVLGFMGFVPVAAQSPVPSATVRSGIEAADSLIALGKLEPAYAILMARLDVAPRDFEARLRAVQNALGLGILGATEDTRLYWLREAEAQGRLLLPLRPHDPDAMAWAAASRGRAALAEGSSRTTVRLAEEVWAITDTLLAIAPDHPLGNHVRGKLHQEAMRLSRFKQIIARVFLGFDLVGQASWLQAEEHLKRAVAGDPGMVLFYLDLGETYRYQGKTQEAEAAYRRGLAVPDRLPVDEHLKQVLRERLAALEGGAGSH